MNREVLKEAAKALLDVVATEHPQKHQNVYALRYLLNRSAGSSIEIMFEKASGSPANLWVREDLASGLSAAHIKRRRSPASQLRTKIGSNGAPNYGRHSALEKMPQLGEADLICFVPENLKELGEIIDSLVSTV